MENKASNPPPEGFTLRAARWKDAPAVLQLIDAVCVADGDPNGSGITLEELRNEWRSPGFAMETDTWVVIAPSGQIIGYEELNNRAEHAFLIGDGYVHPEFTGHGIGTALLRAMEVRAHQMMTLADPNLRVFIHNGMGIKDHAARKLHENEGYHPVRYFWQMQIELEEPPPAPKLPTGIHIHPFRVGVDEHIIFKTIDDAFRDTWGYVHRSFEAWKHSQIDSPTFDPSLWFLAWDGDQVAGSLICRYRNDRAWIGTLGVRSVWRKRGLGLALLLHAFNVFYQRGSQIIGLGVDSSNPTGATHLYEKAGMRVSQEYVVYEKEIRPGKEFSVKSFDE